MNTQRHQFKLMIPPDVKAWLVEQAEKNMRSQGAEIVYAIRQRMAAEATAQK